MTFRRLKIALRELNGVEGRVGYFEQHRYPDGPPVAQVAAVHELGNASRGIPPRPTLGPAIDNNTEEYKRLLASGARSVLAGKASAVDVMEATMLRAASDVATEISRLTSPPLKEATIKRKGSSKPLVETRYMIRSVTGVAERTK